MSGLCGDAYAPTGARMEIASRFQPLMATIASVSATISFAEKLSSSLS